MRGVGPGVKDGDVRLMALRCMSSVLLFAPDSKQLLVKLRVFMNGQATEALFVTTSRSTFGSCALQVMLRVALAGNDRDEASAALSVLSSFFDSNTHAQKDILSAILPFEDQPRSNGMFISEILKAVDTCREGSEMGRRAAQVGHHLGGSTYKDFSWPHRC